jgi:1,4-alpha-glucan branching enzyme
VTHLQAGADRRARLDGLVEVTFRIPLAFSATASVVGEFNDWDPDANPMEREGEGFSATFTIPGGRHYRFRYLLDGERWQNDWTADSYVSNEFGGDDSVLDLTDFAPLRPPAAGRRSRHTCPPATPSQ